MWVTVELGARHPETSRSQYQTYLCSRFLSTAGELSRSNLYLRERVTFKSKHIYTQSSHHTLVGGEECLNTPRYQNKGGFEVSQCGDMYKPC